MDRCLSEVLPLMLIESGSCDVLGLILDWKQIVTSKSNPN